jgi:glutaminyl-peptide cyclotransferase
MRASTLVTLVLMAAGNSSSRHSTLMANEDESHVRHLGVDSSQLTDSYVSTYEIVATFDHDPNAFTQGLAFSAAGTLYESDGLYHQSSVRSVQVNADGTTSTLKCVPLPTTEFAEGITIVGDKLLQITWKEKVMHEYTINSASPGAHAAPGSIALATLVAGDLQKVKDHPHDYEGWGLAADGDKLYTTDGSDQLYTLALSDRRLLSKKTITDPKLAHKDGTPFSVHGVNELEMVGGELWGNLYPMYQGSHSECIARIDPATGEVKGWIDMHGLFDLQSARVKRNPGSYVLNGIAYHEPSGRLYVTGKQWDKMYQVRIKPAAELDAAQIKAKCGLGVARG